MDAPFNYRHLYYFWVVGKEGGLSRAAERLGMAVQTVSTQIRELERSLGAALLKPEGRRLVMTPAGEAAMRQADAIFTLGAALPARVREAAGPERVRLAVGISDGVPKLVVRTLLQPVLGEARLHLLCHEGEFDELLAELALHRLDLVLSDRPATPNTSLKLQSQLVASAQLGWFAPPAWADAARRGFPTSLATVPVLLPTRHAAARALLDRWFERQGVRPNVVGEFEDSALLATFGAGGMGVFPAVDMIREALLGAVGVAFVGGCEGVEERYFAMAAQRKVLHPLVQRLLVSRV